MLLSATATSQKRTQASREHVISTLPSGANATDVTIFEWPSTMALQLPAST
jgi:hypothetical protein